MLMKAAQLTCPRSKSTNFATETSLAPGDACRRLFLDVPAKGAKLDVTVEARDRVHSAEILNALSEGGYQPVQIA
jgi:hypothetical protein